MKSIKEFASAASSTADSLIGQLPEQTQLLAAYAIKNGYRIALSFEVDQNGLPVILLDLVNDLEQRQNLIRCDAEMQEKN